MAKYKSESLRRRSQPNRREPVAIIGIGCRFPGANGPEEFWRMLRDGVDAIKETPKDRFDVDAIYDPRPGTPGKLASRKGGFLDDVDKFDAEFFAISPREAVMMDPQQRLAIEVAWEALEDAGLPIDKLTGGNAGVYMGACSGDYESVVCQDIAGLNIYSAVGALRSAVPGRISYAFGLEGPSILIDAGCASSLVAVHLACQGLLNGECEIALAGGTNLIFTPYTSIAVSQAGMLAPDGRCKTFDAGADGFIRSEGVGIVALKPLSRALADGDMIYATILGTAVNDDGQGNGFFFNPSVEGHRAVLKEAYRAAGISPDSVQYVEAHGTGTRVGDPTEARALGTFFSEGRPADRPLIVGSVKSNIGHAEGAAGVAGLIKVALSLQHRQIPPSLHVREPNPEIPWSELRLKVQTELGAWPIKPADVARAGVSSLGISGTNSHAALEEPPRVSTAERAGEIQGDRKRLLALSARSQAALKRMAADYRSFLLSDEGAAPSLYDICYTSGVRRSHHKYRLTTVGDSKEAHAARLEEFLRDESSGEMVYGEAVSGERRKIAFVFSGHGAQWLGMGRRLLDQEPVFRSIIVECDRLLARHVDWSLLEELRADDPNSKLNRNDVIQPALFAVQVALAGLWRSWGIEPDAVVGHSMGEVAAAYVAGALDLDEACRLMRVRSCLLDRLRGKGSMAMVEMSIDQARELLAGYEDRVSIAINNSPRAIVLSGDTSALQEIAATLETRDVLCRFVKADGAGHSPQVEPLCVDLINALRDLKPKPATVPIYSCVTGDVIAGESLDAEYWAANIRKTVLFSIATDRLRRDGFNLFLEVAAHPILQMSVKQVFQHAGAECDVIASMRRDEDDHSAMLGAFGALYAIGRAGDWNRFYARRGELVRLPAYPWQKERFWVDINETAHDQAGWQGFSQASSSTAHPLLGYHLEYSVDPGLHIWETDLSLSRLSYLSDSRLQNKPLFPAAAYLEIARAGMAEVLGDQPYLIEDVEFKQNLFLPEIGNAGRQKAQLVISPESPGLYSFKYSSRLEEAKRKTGWAPHAGGKIRTTDITMSATFQEPPREIRKRCVDAVSGADFYEEMRERNAQYGPKFQGVTEIWRRDGEVLARVSVPETVASEASRYQIHPALLDACLHAVMAALPEDSLITDPDTTYLPVAIRRLRVEAPVPSELWSHASLHADLSQNPETIECDVSLISDEGQLFAQVEGLRLDRLVVGSTDPDAIDQLMYEMRWEPAPAWQAQNGNRNPYGIWIIFADATHSADSISLGRSLASLLESGGENCIVVSPGPSYLRRGQAEFEINRSRLEDFQRLFKELGAQQSCRGIVYLWSLDTSMDSFEQEQDLGSGSVIYLLQGMAEAGWSERPYLRMVTRRAQPIKGETQSVALSQATILGLGLVIAKEHPELRCKVIDLATEDAEQEARSLSAELFHEDEEVGVVLSGDARYVPRLARSSQHLGPEPASMRNTWTESLEPKADLFRPDATYLISGGLGGLGLAVARWMVASGARYLAFAGRSAPSAKAEKVLKDLSANGATILIEQCDVSNSGQVASLIGKIKRTMPPLRGIMHLAATFKHAVLMRLSLENFKEVMAPKAVGAWNLHSLTLDEPLEFFVLFSSAASLLGSPAHANYVAANAFLDTLAHYRRSLGLPALSLNWGAWAAAGPVASGEFRKLLAERGLYSITLKHGLLALEKCMRQELTQIACMNLNAERWSQYFAAGSRNMLLTHLIGEQDQVGNGNGHAPSLKASLLAEPQMASRKAMIDSFLKEHLAKVLRTSPERIDSASPLSRQGLDSLMSIEFRNRLESQLRIALTPLLTWKYPTVTAMAHHLAEKMNVPIEMEPANSSPQTLETELIREQLQQLAESELGAKLAARLQALNEI